MYKLLLFITRTGVETSQQIGVSEFLVTVTKKEVAAHSCDPCPLPFCCQGGTASMMG
jgi:hypothetical protein